MPACTAYELTLSIELIVLERSNKETAKIVILCVHTGAFWHSLALQTSQKILNYMRFTRLSVTLSNGQDCTYMLQHIKN